MNPALQELQASGIPGELLLVLALLIWTIFALILLSSPRNPLHIWCFLSGAIFGIGALKEFLFYTLGPKLIVQGIWTDVFSETLYSILSAIFYYFSMPTVLVFCYYFHHWEQSSPSLFSRLRIITFIPPLAMAAIFPYTQTLTLQNVPAFCITVGLYNWLYGFAGTAVIVHALWSERFSARFVQRRSAAVVLLAPLWFWLISAFPYHALGIPNLRKLWQVNLLVVFLVLVYFLYHAFRDGIWGLRFRRETYDWDNGSKVLQKNAQYLGHALKNDLAKIAWCADALSAQGVSTREIDILRRSTNHLQQFIKHTQLYSQDISLCPELCQIDCLLENLMQEYNREAGKPMVQILFCDTTPLLCDPTHIEEVLYNLITNAIDASGQNGQVFLSYRNFPKKHRAILTVSDNGPGIDQETAKHIFEPYYSTKAGKQNMGLGLYYCWNVMNAHGGKVTVASTPGNGSQFTLLFPLKHHKGKKGLQS